TLCHGARTLLRSRGRHRRVRITRRYGWRLEDEHPIDETLTRVPYVRLAFRLSEMSLAGPILIISDRPDRKLAVALAGAGASPVVESALREAAGALSRI